MVFMGSPPPIGVTLQMIPFRGYAAVGVARWGDISRLIPDPLWTESAAGQRNADRRGREYSDLRATIQRVLKGTAKGRNVYDYARYIAAALRGERGHAWSTPPLCLWSSEPLAEIDGQPYARVMPLSSHLIAVDAETQVAALHLLAEDPEKYRLTATQVDGLMVPYELYWSISIKDARQIFHDRNWHGVPVAKTLALSMDGFDQATTLTQRLLEDVQVTVDGEKKLLGSVVNMVKRQLTATSPEWVTLSGLRSLVVTTMLGRPGIVATANAVTTADFPDDVEEEQVAKEVVQILGATIERFNTQFAQRTAITTPACLAGIGVAAHRTTSWCTEEPKLTQADLLAMLEDVVWERRADVWDGVAGRRTAKGGITFGGGAKDSGGRVADAILLPGSALGQQIRGVAQQQEP
jgi:DndB-like DNA-sulfur modification-associated protein